MEILIKRALMTMMVFLVMAVSAAEKPNVIYILADDLGYGEVGYNGQEMIKTPELDAMAAAGMKFTNHYCGNAVCAPTRCSLMTGLHPGHAYIRANSPGYPNGQTPLPEGTETVAHLAKRAGYATAIIGKWGLGGVLEDVPLLVGFSADRGRVVFSSFHWRSQNPSLANQLMIYAVEGLNPGPNANIYGDE